MCGESKLFDEYKQRFETQKLIRVIPDNEVKKLIKKQSYKMEWNYYEACFPVNPLKIKVYKVEKEDIELLKEWASVRASVRASVGDSVGAYISSFFPNIKKWKYVDHKKGENPFQSCIDLWKKGLISSYDGNLWRLHSGENAEILWEGKI